MDEIEKKKYQSLINGCRYFGIELNEKQIWQFGRYYDLLTEWNQVMNLTAITDFEEVMQKHFVDSLAAVKCMEIEKTKTLLDVGTGAGFPGLPLKMIYPQLKVVLLDSLNKRIRFLDEVVDKLGLTDVETIHGRAEDFGKRAEYRETFDVVVSRAVSNLASLSEYCIPFVKKGGYFISYKSGNVEEEAEQARKAVYVLGGKQKMIEKFSLPESDMERSLVVIEKIAGTPKKYPRKAGTAVKDPIK